MTTRLHGGRVRLLGAVLAIGLVAAACGDDGEAGTGGGNVEQGLGGAIVISGSSTVEPISVAVAEKFSSINPDVAIDVTGPGTGDGFELFCNGETDISDASRPIGEEEIAACEQSGIEYIELKVAIDGLSVLTSPENEAIDCLDFRDLYALLGPESEGFGQWSDANSLAEELGAGHAPYPDEPLEVTAPGEESGTYDSFIEIVLEDLAEERGQDAVTRPDYQSSANDSVIIDGIAGSPGSLGWVGYAFYVQNPDVVKALAIADGEGGECVEPTPETAASGEYPIARDLFIYVNAEKMEQNPAVEAYVDYYLTDEGIASVHEVGYVDLADEDIQSTRDVWESKETGTREG